MANKTPQFVKAMHKQYGESRTYVDECLLAKQSAAENQPDHVRNLSEEHWVGVIAGMTYMLEFVLFEYDCYNGFKYVNANGVQVGLDDPDFRDWRREYFISE